MYCGLEGANFEDLEQLEGKGFDYFCSAKW